MKTVVGFGISIALFIKMHVRKPETLRRKTGRDRQKRFSDLEPACQIIMQVGDTCKNPSSKMFVDQADNEFIRLKTLDINRPDFELLHE